MKKKKANIIYVLICLFGLFSCEYEAIEPVEVVIVSPPGGLSFTTHIIPIFNKSCNGSGCHVAGHFKVDLTPANAYADLFAKNLIDTLTPVNSKLYTKLTDAGSSHLTKVESGQPETILKWIEEGAKNN
ncbi:MAG: hypothetical protein K9J13_15925 [Saprospiraceae bacterium]|nr:hypothetical protein [Saprospiraceae bacterium]